MAPKTPAANPRANKIEKYPTRPAAAPAAIAALIAGASTVQSGIFRGALLATGGVRFMRLPSSGFDFKIIAATLHPYRRAPRDTSSRVPAVRYQLTFAKCCKACEPAISRRHRQASLLALPGWVSTCEGGRGNLEAHLPPSVAHEAIPRRTSSVLIGAVGLGDCGTRNRDRGVFQARFDLGK